MKPKRFLCEKIEPRTLLAAGQKIVSLPDSSASQVIEAASYWFITKTQGSTYGETLTATDKQTQTTRTLFSSDVAAGDNAIRGLELLNDKLYFYASSGTTAGLYESDGTVPGTKAIRLMSVTNNSGPGVTWKLGGKLYSYWYAGNDRPSMLFASDGTAAGTLQVGEAPAKGVTPVPFTSDAAGNLWFKTSNGLWVADDSNPVPRLFASGFDARTLANVTQLVSTGSRIYFTSYAWQSNQSQYTQWLYTCNADGSDLRELTIPTAANYTYKPTIGSIALSGNKLLFLSAGILWSLEGAEPAVEVLNTGYGIYGNQYSKLFSTTSGRVAFYHGKSNFNDASEGLYSSDGTAAGTVQLLQHSISDFRFVTGYEAGRYIYILPNPIEELNIGWNITQTDGTTAGTRRIRYLANEAPGATFVGAIGDQPLVISRNANGSGAGIWAINPEAGVGSMEGNVFADWTRDGLFQPFELTYHGTFYLDINGNGVYEGGSELGQLTVNNGYFKIDSLSEGTYTVRFKPEYASTPAVHSPTGDHWQVTIGPGSRVTHVNFTADPSFTFVWGKVFDDLDADGMQDEDEAGAYNQNFFLDLNGDGVFTTGEPEDASDRDGYFYFQGAASGEVRVGRRDQAQYIQTSPLLRGGRRGQLESAGSLDVGTFGVHAQLPGTVSGVAWNDNNSNGVLDGDDTPLSGAAIFVDLNLDGVRQPVEPIVFSNAGRFTFTATPSEMTTFRLARHGSYPAGTVITPEAGYTFVVPSGMSRNDLVFLMSRPGLAQSPGVVEGVVYEDRNRDGLQQEGEQGLPNMLVFVDADGDGLVDASERRDLTDGSGRYAFPHSAIGLYRVRVELEAGQTYSVAAPPDVWLSNSASVHVLNMGVAAQDVSAPTVTHFQYFANSRTAWLQFDEALKGSAYVEDFVVRGSQGGVITGAVANVTYNESNRRIVISLDSDTPHLATGLLELLYIGSTLSDLAGNAVTPSEHEFGAIDGDVTGDGSIDFADLLLLAQSFGQAGLSFSQGNIDYSADGLVNFDDLLILAQHFGGSPARTVAPTRRSAGRDRVAVIL